MFFSSYISPSSWGLVLFNGLAVPYGFILNPEHIQNNSELSPTCKHVYIYGECRTKTEAAWRV